MSVGSVIIGLQASRRDGKGVAASEFLTPLAVKSDEVEATQADGGQRASAMVYLAVVRYSAFAHIDTSADAGAQSEAFYRGVVEAFRAAGTFLDVRPASVTAAIRATGISLRLFVDVRMDQDQMEVEFPPEFLAACGRHGLGIYLLTNDITAAEVLASRNA